MYWLRLFIGQYVVAAISITKGNNVRCNGGGGDGGSLVYGSILVEDNKAYLGVLV